MRRIGILTSGGDAPGMNAAIRSAIRTALKNDMEIYGIYDGYKGLVDGDIHPLDYRDASEILIRGGTVLGSSRLPEFKDDVMQEIAINQLKRWGIEGLVVIGGDGSYRGAQALTHKGIMCVGIPGTIDNDINGTEKTIGFSTALNTICDAVNKLRDTSYSHHRCFIVEVMGNRCGKLALWSAITCGAEVLINQDLGYDENRVLAQLAIHDQFRHKRHALIITAENMIDIDELAQLVSEKTHFSGRSISLGHIQRGGSPTPEDRMLASKMGRSAVEVLMRGQGGKCICSINDEIVVRDIDEALADTSFARDEELYELFNDLV